MIEFRLPLIMGTTEEQTSQLRNYLYQLIPQLQMVLNGIEDGSYGGVGEWVSIGLSSYVKPTEKKHGRVDNDCLYRINHTEKKVTVALNCAATFSGGVPLKANATSLPIAYRPKKEVMGVCMAMGGVVARIRVNTSGDIFVEHDTDGYLDWIDGYIEYWV